MEAPSRWAAASSGPPVRVRPQRVPTVGIANWGGSTCYFNSAISAASAYMEILLVVMLHPEVATHKRNHKAGSTSVRGTPIAQKSLDHHGDIFSTSASLRSANLKKAPFRPGSFCPICTMTALRDIYLRTHNPRRGSRPTPVSTRNFLSKTGLVAAFTSGEIKTVGGTHKRMYTDYSMSGDSSESLLAFLDILEAAGRLLGLEQAVFQATGKGQEALGHHFDMFQMSVSYKDLEPVVYALSHGARDKDVLTPDETTEQVDACNKEQRKGCRLEKHRVGIQKNRVVALMGDAVFVAAAKAALAAAEEGESRRRVVARVIRDHEWRAMKCDMNPANRSTFCKQEPVWGGYLSFGKPDDGSQFGSVASLMTPAPPNWKEDAEPMFSGYLRGQDHKEPGDQNWPAVRWLSGYVASQEPPLFLFMQVNRPGYRVTHSGHMIEHTETFNLGFPKEGVKVFQLRDDGDGCITHTYDFVSSCNFLGAHYTSVVADPDLVNGAGQVARLSDSSHTIRECEGGIYGDTTGGRHTVLEAGTGNVVRVDSGYMSTSVVFRRRVGGDEPGPCGLGLAAAAAVEDPGCACPEPVVHDAEEEEEEEEDEEEYEDDWDDDDVETEEEEDEDDV